MWDVTARAPLITGLQGFHTARISSLAYSAAGVLVRLRVMFRVRVWVWVWVRVRVRVRLTLTLILTLTRRARLGGHRLDAARVGPRRQEAQDQVDGLPHRGRHQQGRLGRRQHRRHRRLGRVHQDLDRLSPSERGSRRGRRAPYAPRRGTRGRCGDRRHLDDIQGRADVIEHMHPPRRTAHGVCRASFSCGLDESEKAVRKFQCAFSGCSTACSPKLHSLSRNARLDGHPCANDAAARAGSLVS